MHVEVYINGKWARSLNDRRSTSGHCSFVWENLVNWQCKKKYSVRNSAKAKFRMVVREICKVMWVKRILEGLKFSHPTPIKVYYDNKVVISVAHNPVLHDRTEHIEMDKYFIKEELDVRIICMTYLLTMEQIVDVLTNGLHKKQLDKLIDKLDMEDIYKPA